MRQFSFTFLVITLVALFVAEFSSGQPTDFTKNNDIKNGVPDVLPCRRYEDRIGCVPFLDRIDYVVTPGIGAHKIHRNRVTWNEARKICMEEGAHLAVLDSAKKEAQFQKWIDKETVVGLWLGFHDLFENGTWITVTGQFVDTLEYQPWSIGQPRSNYDKHCAMLFEIDGRGGGASTFKCKYRVMFICEINLCSALNQTVSNEKLVKLS
ncbi:hemolymph lipopolysaccharide-binding protein-like [Megalopta genalis]|uniref:hemolymph lipopolysaccharide-binding protein-like n=1 Tax=Megalopta genalis TaxID=115081 RepID=UPI003FD16671